ncbi:helix-turn-helix domain-containing protein [Bifidobacterium stellenboschense]|uniref:XRE family transcriptional regulator n=1 Tax=Bifidobacterium stellenboschense TaxID=762211 RepID=A0A087DGE4_9BIFI|nr:helix-turn-helix transcriptional regulator [Bifidobacterium stellenboschense]KFI94594.1 XRE family transcriptional regulator [Bifidobacterium stellenboschense]
MTKELGERMLKLMRQQGRTQKKVAELIGTTEATMSRYVSGDREPKADVLSNIATALHTTSDYLLGRESEQNDLDSAYTLVARNASRLTPEQKHAILEALFSSNTEDGK